MREDPNRPGRNADNEVAMKRSLKILPVSGLAAAATLATSTIDETVIATYPGIMGCQAGCRVAAVGWPVPYLVDYPGISPVGSVDLIGAILGIDMIWPAQLAGTFLFWCAIGAAVVWILTRTRGGQKKARTGRA